MIQSKSAGRTSRKFSETQVLHCTCGDKRLLWIEEHVCQRVKPDMVVGNVDAHGLLTHSRLVRVTWRLHYTTSTAAQINT